MFTLILKQNIIQIVNIIQVSLPFKKIFNFIRIIYDILLFKGLYYTVNGVTLQVKPIGGKSEKKYSGGKMRFYYKFI